MKLIAGFLLLFTAFIGTIFFKNYSGEIISYPVLWYFLFFSIGIMGILLIRSGAKGAMNIVKKHADDKVAQLKASSEKFQLDYDRCEFRNGSYYREVVDENVNSLNIVSPGFHYTPMKTESVASSTLVYHLSEAERFVESFPVDPITLKTYVTSNKIVLYVSRFDRSKYAFEILTP